MTTPAAADGGAEVSGPSASPSAATSKQQDAPVPDEQVEVTPETVGAGLVAPQDAPAEVASEQDIPEGYVPPTYE